MASFEDLIETLANRFAENSHRHEGVEWETVRARLESSPDKLATLAELERTGGEPDVVGHDPSTGETTFFDCSPESPAGRRSLCYDDAALAARKKHKPDGSAVGLAEAMGAELLDEDQYQTLQALDPCDRKTSSWLRTPADVRERGGAIFGDRRYGRVFVYHNSAESYYGARGFRCFVRL